MIRVNQQGFANQNQGLENNSQNQFSSQFQNNQAFDQVFPNQQSFNQNQQAPPFDNQLSAPQGFFKIPEQYLKLISVAPFVLEMLTGQKVPPTGAMADILNGVQGLQVSLQQVLAQQRQLLNGQQQLWTKLESLESNAVQQLTEIRANSTQQFTNLASQVQSIKSIRLTHSKENKSIEYNANPELNEPEQNAIEYN